MTAVARARHLSLVAAACLLLVAGVAAAATIGTLRAPDRGSTPRLVADGATLALSDDAGGSALFSLPAATGGQTVTRCIRITYDGAPSQPVRLSAAGVAPGTLAPLIDVTVEAGTGGGYADCTGFSGQTLFEGTLADLEAAYPDYDHGLAAFVPTAAEPSKSFRITMHVRDTNVAQGRTAGVTLAWTAVDASTPPPATTTEPPPTPTADPTDATATPAQTTTPITTTPQPPSRPHSEPARPTDDGPTGTREPQGGGDASAAPGGEGILAGAAPNGAPPAPSLATPTANGSAPTHSSGGANGGPTARTRPEAHRPRETVGSATAPVATAKSEPHDLLSKVLGKRIGRAVQDVAGAVGRAAAPVAERSAFPLLLLVVMGWFLVVQDWIDRRDPKLALAPLRSDDLPFTDGPSDEETETP